MPFKVEDDRRLIGSLADYWDGLDNDSKIEISGTWPELFKWLQVFSSLAAQGRIHVESDDALESVQQAARIIEAARDSNGPPDSSPSMLWSALCSMWDHLDTLQQAIANGEYSEKETHQTGCVCADCSGAELTSDND